MVGQRRHNVRRRHYSTRKIGVFGNSRGISLPPRPAMHTVPAQDIISVIDTLCELAKTAGYGAPIETAQRDSGFQYSDILETGPPGSRDAPDIDKEGAE